MPKTKKMSTIRGLQEDIYLRIIRYNQPAYSDVIFARSKNINNRTPTQRGVFKTHVNTL